MLRTHYCSIQPSSNVTGYSTRSSPSKVAICYRLPWGCMYVQSATAIVYVVKTAGQRSIPRCPITKTWVRTWKVSILVSFYPHKYHPLYLAKQKWLILLVTWNIVTKACPRENPVTGERVSNWVGCYSITEIPKVFEATWKSESSIKHRILVNRDYLMTLAHRIRIAYENLTVFYFHTHFYPLNYDFYAQISVRMTNRLLL